MNMVNGFDIDTLEGSEDYLRSEGVDVDAYIKRGLNELKKQKTLDLASTSGTCSYCKGLGYDPLNNSIGVHDLCPECNDNSIDLDVVINL